MKLNATDMVPGWALNLATFWRVYGAVDDAFKEPPHGATYWKLYRATRDATYDPTVEFLKDQS